MVQTPSETERRRHLRGSSGSIDREARRGSLPIAHRRPNWAQEVASTMDSPLQTTRSLLAKIYGQGPGKGCRNEQTRFSRRRQKHARVNRHLRNAHRRHSKEAEHNGIYYRVEHESYGRSLVHRRHLVTTAGVGSRFRYAATKDVFFWHSRS